MGQDNQAGRTLSDRLRAASIERASRRGDVVDDRVLDPTGVIDLRDDWAEPAPPGLSAALEAASSATTLFHRVSPTHRPGRPDSHTRAAGPTIPGRAPAPATVPETEPASLPTRTPAASAFEAPETTTSPALSEAFLSIEIDSFREEYGDGDDRAVREYPVIGQAPEPPADSAPSAPVADSIDLRGQDPAGPVGPAGRDEERPRGTCPSCGGTGQSDLFDRFSQTDYFSCDDCSAMWQVARD